ncbi:hypothetical protein MPH_02909 [Macrophomina phaseolina MS6]|uniref:Uncharacterized protein n=1 Tax=Macrophomina phaseolina (strain MS6) TaxID=1126212 RepID=K2RYC2_MACPH|nr:hypothetical protein MPH_02909 [Macrophomina phaseolina MS6]
MLASTRAERVHLALSRWCKLVILGPQVGRSHDRRPYVQHDLYARFQRLWQTPARGHQKSPELAKSCAFPLSSRLLMTGYSQIHLPTSLDATACFSPSRRSWDGVFIWVRPEKAPQRRKEPRPCGSDGIIGYSAPGYYVLVLCGSSFRDSRDDRRCGFI